MLFLLFTPLLSLPETTGIACWFVNSLCSALHLPSVDTEWLNQKNLKLALQVLGIVVGLPDGIKQSVTQSMGIQALQYSWWWRKSGKAQWIKLKQGIEHLKRLGQTPVTLAWHRPLPLLINSTKPSQP